MPSVVGVRPVAKKVTSFRVSEEASRMLDELEADTGLTRSALIELALRDLHSRRFRGKKSKKSPEKPGENT